MNKTIVAITLLSFLVVTMAVECGWVLVEANPYFHGGYDPTPPIKAKITINSPANSTVYSSNLTLNFNVSFVNPDGFDYSVYLDSINYTLSWENESKQIYKWNYYDEYNLDPSNDDPQISEYQYEEVLTNIPEGKQKITINLTANGDYIEAWTRYYFHINESATVELTVDNPSTMQPFLKIGTEQDPSQLPTPILVLVLVGAFALIICVGTLIYFCKNRYVISQSRNLD